MPSFTASTVTRDVVTDLMVGNIIETWPELVSACHEVLDHFAETGRSVGIAGMVTDNVKMVLDVLDDFV